MLTKPRWSPREIDLITAVAVVATGVLGYLVRHTLSPDGVAYLDLARALQRGDFPQFVQGYWSPLYPAVLAAVNSMSGGSISAELELAHVVNVVAIVVTLLVICRWARNMTSPWFGRAAVTALIVCSAEPPRVEAVTPDLVLLCLLVCIAYEIIVRKSERWLLLGLLFGLTYLTKTSVWPWLLLAMTLRTLVAPTRVRRITTLRAHAVTVMLMLCWVIPISLDTGHVTFGSTGRLNYGWYLKSSDARTPDTHRGEHLRYRQVAGGDPQLAWADLDGDDGWTYHPWSDPDDWSQGITSARSVPPTFPNLISYWAEAAWMTTSVWLRTLLVFVLLPALWIGRRSGCWRELLLGDKPALLVMGLGAAGIAQFIAVHAEPRLIAPFALFCALGAIQWRVGDRAPTSDRPIWSPPATIDRHVASLIGVAVAAYITAARIYHAVDDDQRIGAGLAQLEAANRSAFAPAPSDGKGLAGMVATSVPDHPRVVVIGPALPVMANVYWTGGRIVAQLAPAAAASFATLPPARQRDLVHELFNGRADAVWFTSPDGGFQIVPVP